MPEQKVMMYPFLINIKCLVSDKHLMMDSNWSYDERVITCGDLNTGDWWKKAECLSCHLLNYGVSKQGEHFLVPILLFIDATHCDRNGHLCAEPVLCSIGNIYLEHSKRPSAWFILGLLPNDTLSPAEWQRLRTGRGH